MTEFSSQSVSVDHTYLFYKFWVLIMFLKIVENKKWRSKNLVNHKTVLSSLFIINTTISFAQTVHKQ